MNKETALSTLRAVLTLIGSYIVGHTVLGHRIDADFWELFGGAALTGLSTLWGFSAKSTTVEQWQSLLRSVFAATSGVLVALGLLNNQTSAAIAGLIPALAATLQGHLSRQTTRHMATGKATADAKTGVVSKAGPKVLIFALLVLSSAFGYSQSPFRALPKVKAPVNRLFRAVNAPADSFQNVWRFTANISPVGYTFSGLYQALAGAQYGYQHIQWDWTTQKWKVLWSVNGAWFPINTATGVHSLADLSTIAVLVGFDNNLIQLGPLYNFHPPSEKDKWGLCLTIGITLNN